MITIMIKKFLLGTFIWAALGASGAWAQNAIVTENQLPGTLAMGGTLVTLGYSAGRTTRVNVTDLIWNLSSMFGWALAAETPATREAAWAQIFPLIESGAVKPLVERSYPLERAAEALRHLVEGRPFGKIVLETGS